MIEELLGSNASKYTVMKNYFKNACKWNRIFKNDTNEQKYEFLIDRIGFKLHCLWIEFDKKTNQSLMIAINSMN